MARNRDAVVRTRSPISRNDALAAALVIFVVWAAARACDRGFIARHHAPAGGVHVSVSAAGAEHLRKHRQPR